MSWKLISFVRERRGDVVSLPGGLAVQRMPLFGHPRRIFAIFLSAEAVGWSKPVGTEVGRDGKWLTGMMVGF